MMGSELRDSMTLEAITGKINKSKKGEIMPIRKSGTGFKVENTKNKPLTKQKAKKQLAAIKINQAKKGKK